MLHDVSVTKSVPQAMPREQDWKGSHAHLLYAHHGMADHETAVRNIKCTPLSLVMG